jgi:hypothetical protein
MILPVFSYEIANKNQSYWVCGMNSQSYGEKFNLITILKSQFTISNTFNVLSIPVDASKSWFLSKVVDVIWPLCALKFLIN